LRTALREIFTDIEPFISRDGYQSFVCSKNEEKPLLIRFFNNNVENYKREKEISNRFSNPCVQKNFELKEIKENHLASEFNEAITLRELIISHGTISINKALGYSLQILSFLKECHLEEIIFRGITPDTIFIDRYNKILIADFQNSFLIGEDVRYAAPAFPRDGIEYLTPEYLNHYQIDFRSDIYQLGLLIFELTTGQLPWKYRSIAKLVQEKSQSVLHLHRVDNSIPIQLSTLVSKMMEPSPKRRFSSAEVVERHIEETISSHFGGSYISDSHTGSIK